MTRNSRVIVIVILTDSKTEEVRYRCLIRLLYSHNPIVEIHLPLAGVTASQRSFGRIQSATEVKFLRSYTNYQVSIRACQIHRGLREHWPSLRVSSQPFDYRTTLSNRTIPMTWHAFYSGGIIWCLYGSIISHACVS